MPWKWMLAYITGSVNESLLLKIEYLLEENRILRHKIQGRLELTDGERRTLAEKAIALGKLMEDTVTIAKRDEGVPAPAGCRETGWEGIYTALELAEGRKVA